MAPIESTGLGSAVTETVETDSPTPGSPAVMPADLSMVVLSVRDMPALRRY
jgi:hypothetical protein